MGSLGSRPIVPYGKMISPVRSYLTTDQNGRQIVVNVTEPGHPLHPGYVVRSVSPSDGGPTIQNEGEGVGVFAGIAFSAHAFSGLDKQRLEGSLYGTIWIDRDRRGPQFAVKAMHRSTLALLVAGLVAPIAFAASFYHKGALDEASYGVLIVVSAIISFSGVVFLGLTGLFDSAGQQVDGVLDRAADGRHRGNRDLVRLQRPIGAAFFKRLVACAVLS